MPVEIKETSPKDNTKVNVTKNIRFIEINSPKIKFKCCNHNILAIGVQYETPYTIKNKRVTSVLV